jgi:membrane protein YqaA with SNARE-associated domain
VNNTKKYKITRKRQEEAYTMMVFLKKLYDWVLHWAHTPYGVPALFILAFAEASFFPVPPDVLLMALSLSIPRRAFSFALVCTMGSVIGGIAGYVIGFQFWEIGKSILFHYVSFEDFLQVKHYYEQYEAMAIGIAGLTPLPYKVFTITAGFFQVNLPIFIGASFVSRALRFFVIAGLIYKFGTPIRTFIDKYFNILTLVFVLLIVLGFLALKGILQK